MLSQRDFADALIAEFPQIRAHVEHDRELIHVQLAWLRLYVLDRAVEDNDTATIRRCIGLLDRFVQQGDEDVVTAIHVAFLEHIEADTRTGEVVLPLLTPKLRRGWQEILKYTQPAADEKKSAQAGKRKHR
jgi:hypothetical protein